MPDFFQTYFIDPIIYNTGYNVVNTATFAVMLIIAVVGTYKLLKKMGVAIDKNFFFGIIPFIALGGVLRAWEDLLEATKATSAFLSSPIKDFILIDATGTPRNLLLVSPMMYVTIFIIALSSLIAAMALQKYRKVPYHKTWFAIGAFVIAVVFAQLRFVNYFAMFLMLGIASAWAFAIYAAKKVSVARNLPIRKFFTNENQFILSVHLFDASTTFVALQFFSYFEQHVVPSFLISLFGPAVMFALKLAVVSVVLWYLDKDMQTETEKRNFIKIAILILGMGPGLRNFLRLGMGV